MSDKIIVGTDGSETAKRAVTEAVRLARALDAELHIVTATKALRDARVSGGAAVEVHGRVGDAIADGILAEAQAGARFGEVTVKSHAIDREPAEALLWLAGKLDASMIVVGSKGMTGGRRILGSVPNTVSHEADCNVLIVATK